MKKYRFLGLTVAASLLSWTASGAGQLDQILQAEKQSNRQLAQAQGQIDRLNDQTDDLVIAYRTVVEENSVLRTYNRQVSAQIKQQEKDVTLLNDQIANITQVRREVMPLIQDMLDGLRTFVNADIPFNKEERLERIEALQALMDQPDVTPSERYRLILERYKTEAEYGQKIDVYSGTGMVDGAEQKVIYISVGRIAFMYQTPDAADSYLWNNTTKEWEKLDSEYNSRIQNAILMTQGSQPDLVRLPVFAPTEAK